MNGGTGDIYWCSLSVPTHGWLINDFLFFVALLQGWWTIEIRAAHVGVKDLLLFIIVIVNVRQFKLFWQWQKSAFYCQFRLHAYTQILAIIFVPSLLYGCTCIQACIYTHVYNQGPNESLVIILYGSQFYCTEIMFLNLLN